MGPQTEYIRVPLCRHGWPVHAAGIARELLRGAIQLHLEFGFSPATVPLASACQEVSAGLIRRTDEYKRGVVADTHSVWKTFQREHKDDPDCASTLAAMEYMRSWRNGVKHLDDGASDTREWSEHGWTVQMVVGAVLTSATLDYCTMRKLRDGVVDDVGCHAWSVLRPSAPGLAEYEASLGFA